MAALRDTTSDHLVVLVVDDDSVLRNRLCRAFRDRGCDAYEAQTAVESIDLAHSVAAQSHQSCSIRLRRLAASYHQSSVALPRRRKCDYSSPLLWFTLASPACNGNQDPRIADPSNAQIMSHCLPSPAQRSLLGRVGPDIVEPQPAAIMTRREPVPADARFFYTFEVAAATNR